MTLLTDEQRVALFDKLCACGFTEEGAERLLRDAKLLEPEETALEKARRYVKLTKYPLGPAFAAFGAYEKAVAERDAEIERLKCEWDVDMRAAIIHGVLRMRCEHDGIKQEYATVSDWLAERKREKGVNT